MKWSVTIAYFITFQHSFFLSFQVLLSMKVLTSHLIVTLPLLVVAHGHDYLQARRHYARQTTATNAAAPTISLFSTNPTAVPLASITDDQSSAPTVALATTVSPGATPSYFPGPSIPDGTSCFSDQLPSYNLFLGSGELELIELSRIR